MSVCEYDDNPCQQAVALEVFSIPQQRWFGLCSAHFWTLLRAKIVESLLVRAYLPDRDLKDTP